MVLWGENRDAIFHRLKVNGIEGARAEGIYATARRERIATIRSVGKRDFLIGLILIVGCVGMFFGLGLDKLSLTHFGTGMGEVLLLPWLLSLLAIIFLGLGLWKCLSGATEIILAPSKQGSITDD